MRQFTHGLSKVPTVKIELWNHFPPASERRETSDGTRNTVNQDNKSLDSRVPVRPDAALGPL